MGRWGSVFSTHTHCQIRHISLAKQKTPVSATRSFKNNTLPGIENVIIVAFVQINNQCLGFWLDLFLKGKMPPFSTPVVLLHLQSQTKQLPQLLCQREHIFLFGLTCL